MKGTVMGTKTNNTKTTGTKTTGTKTVKEETTTTTPTTVGTIDDWNSYIDDKVAKYQAEGKTVYTSVDDNGAKHYSIYSQEGADKFKNNVSDNQLYTDKSGNVYTNTISQKSVDDKINSAVEEALAKQQNDYQTQLNQYLNQYSTLANNAYTSSQKQYEEQLAKALEASSKAVNNAYDDSAQKYYQLYKQQVKALPEQLSSAGVSGGQTESANLAVLNSYGNNLLQNENSRNNSLLELDSSYNDKIAENSKEVANNLASSYLNMAQQAYGQQLDDASYLYKYNLEKADAEAEAQAQAQLDAEVAEWNSNVAEAIQKRLDAGTTIYSWKDDDGKVHWTTKLGSAAASGYTYKTLKPGTKVSSSGSSSGSSNGSSYSNDTVVNGNSDTTKSNPYATYYNNQNTVDSSSPYSTIFKQISNAKTLTQLASAEEMLKASKGTLSDTDYALLVNTYNNKVKTLS